MADRTHIEWTDATWNPINGCSVVSPGCTNCYAMRLAGTRLKHHPSRQGLTVDSKAGPVWNGQVRLVEAELAKPLRWTGPRRIFVCAHGDLFHDAVPDAWIDRVFAVMALSPQHTFQVLTKRPERMRAYLAAEGVARRIWCAGDFMACDMNLSAAHPSDAYLMAGWERATAEFYPLPNIWLGVSVEDQVRADDRIPILLATPAAVRWISAEPLLGPVDLTRIDPRSNGEGGLVWTDALAGHSVEAHDADHLDDCDYLEPADASLDWVVAGGESGPGARPMHPDWARQLRDQCAAAGVPFFFKQWGAWTAYIDRDRQDPDWRYDYGRLDGGSFRWLNLEGGRGFHGLRFHVMQRVPTKIAGRLLDGQLHDGYPATPAGSGQ